MTTGEERSAAYLPESASDWYESREQHRALRTYADQVVLLPTVGRERALAENVLELLDEVERLRALVTRAEYDPAQTTAAVANAAAPASLTARLEKSAVEEARAIDAMLDLTNPYRKAKA